MPKNILISQDNINPLEKVDNKLLLANILNPLTNKPYEGIILFGEFVSFDVLNNNNRIYTTNNYLQYLEILRQTALSPKGLYGELEHPKDYPIKYNNVSHKILDFYYDPNQNKVFGYVLLLDTPNGKIAQEIIKSGGQLGISARGGGEEVKLPNGTMKAEISLLITFDLVNHPGFGTAVLSYENNLNNLNESILTHIQYVKSDYNNFKKLYESENIQDKKDIQILEEDPDNEHQTNIKNQLKSASNNDLKTKEVNLSQSEKIIKQCDEKINKIFESIEIKKTHKLFEDRNRNFQTLLKK